MSETSQDYQAERERMVRVQLEGRDISDQRVLAAMREVPRHLFVPAEARDQAYEDHPLPIGEDQTISQPYIVALMTQLAACPASGKVLEVGTGSGYQAAVLSRLVAEVYSVEIVPSLAERSARLLEEIGYDNVQVRQGDGYQGWTEHAPFDCILVTAAPEKIPPPLLEQLAVGGRLVIPVGHSTFAQNLMVVRRTETGYEESAVIPVRFVPMTGEAERRRRP